MWRSGLAHVGYGWEDLDFTQPNLVVKPVLTDRRTAWLIAQHNFAMIVCLLALVFGMTAPVAQEAGQETPIEPEEMGAPGAVATAPVVIDGETYFFVRGSLSYSPEERALEIERRIVKAAEAGSNLDPQMRLETVELGIEIYADGVEITGVTEADAALEGFRIEIAAAIISKRISEAIRNYRALRTTSSLERGIFNALGWTLVYVMLVGGLLLLWRFRRRLTKVRVQRFLDDVEQRSGRVINPAALIAAVRLLARGLITVIITALTYYYVALVLFEFGYTRAFATILLDTLAAPLLGLAQAALSEIPDLITLVIIILITNYLLKILRLFFLNIENGVIQFENFRTEWIWPTHRLVRAGIFLCAIVIGYPYIPGSDSDAFRGMTIFLGLVISIGSNSVISNLLAGLIVIYKHSVNVGDRIRVGEIVGDVERVTLLDTLVRSLKNEMVSVPNSTLLNSQVVNFSQTKGTEGLRIHTTVGIGYDEPRSTVERLLIEAAEATPGLKADPAPFVLRTNLGSHDVSYELNACLKPSHDSVEVKSDLNARILDSLHAAGVQIMTPFYVADPDEPKLPKAPTKTAAAKGRS